MSIKLSDADLSQYVKLYLDEKRNILDKFPIQDVLKAVNMVFEVYDNGKTIYAMANGGNAGTVDHLYCDFKHHPFVSEDKTKMLANVKRLRFVNLCSSSSELTGLVNDLGGEMMFAGALAPEVEAGDLVMGFSGSGNSPNIIRAFEVAKQKGAKTLAITRGDGGKSKSADLCIIIPGDSKFPGQTGKNNNNFHFEDAVLYINSIIIGLLKEKVNREANAAS